MRSRKDHFWGYLFKNSDIVCLKYSTYNIYGSLFVMRLRECNIDIRITFFWIVIKFLYIDKYNLLILYVYDQNKVLHSSEKRLTDVLSDKIFSNKTPYLSTIVIYCTVEKIQGEPFLDNQSVLYKERENERSSTLWASAVDAVVNRYLVCI